MAHVLEGFGVRAQFWLGQVKDESSPVCGSVFECRLTRGMKERLLRALEALQVESGTIHLYPARSDRKPTYLGPPRAGPARCRRRGTSHSTSIARPFPPWSGCRESSAATADFSVATRRLSH